MNYKTLPKVALFVLIFGWAIFAANTIRVTVPETTNDTSWPKSYDAQELYIQSWTLDLINLNNDDILVGDYFSWFYHDSAYWAFEMQYSWVSGNSSDTQWVTITGTDVSSDCWDSTTYAWYKLNGFSYNKDFWAMNFSHDTNNYVFICVPRLENSELSSFLWGNAYSELIGTQYFGWIEFDAYVDRSIDHSSEARYVKIEWVTSSQNENTSSEDFDDDLRIIWNIEKSSLRKNILQQVYAAILNAPIDNDTRQVPSTSVSSSQWSNWSGWGTILRNGSVLYFGNLEGNRVTLNGSSDISGIKTLIVEGWNIFINSDIIDGSWDSDMLWLIAVSKSDSSGNIEGWNIIIDSDVTDIHASLYADRSILSFAGWDIADGDTSDSSLANQLFIRGSIFSENTIGWAVSSPYTCPFYVDDTCDEVLAKKYDLSFLRRYILVAEVDEYWVPTWVSSPRNWWSESSTVKAWYESYPLIVEYNPVIQTTPPPFFGE